MITSSPRVDYGLKSDVDAFLNPGSHQNFAVRIGIYFIDTVEFFGDSRPQRGEAFDRQNVMGMSLLNGPFSGFFDIFRCFQIRFAVSKMDNVSVLKPDVR